MPDNHTINTSSTVEPQSKVKASGFANFMSGLFGWRRPRSNNPDKIQFVRVDVGNDEKVGQALINRALNLNDSTLSEHLEDLYNTWLNDTTDKSSELAQRAYRISQIDYACLNDPYIGRFVDLVADEACQLDEQDTLIQIDSADDRMTKRMYQLLSQWGITPSRAHGAIKDLAKYGDAFWANKATENGVERIIPLKQLQITDRIEFSPVDAMEAKKRREGSLYSLVSNNYLLQQMLDTLEDTNDFADMFDKKLFGFSVDRDLTVPSWLISHFRIDGEGGQFAPFGTSLIIGALAPFKQTASTITLQSLARIMSFPITLYKVKTSDNMDEGRQFAVVNRVREAYDNIGVTPKTGTSEVYTVNTKIWMPDGLMDVEVKDPGTDFKFTDDIEIYQNRTAVALGLPLSYFEKWGEFGNSGVSLIQQYKPFARKVYTAQASFLETLADLYRIHFAITGEFDFRVPFTLSMRFPAEEASDDKIKARRDSLDIANDVINMIKSVIGADDDEGLPPEIVRDIVAKYTFLDPKDIIAWTKDAKLGNATDLDSSLGGGGSSDFGPGESNSNTGDLDDLDLGSDESSSSDEEGLALESIRNNDLRLQEAKRIREKKLIESYKKNRESIYLRVLQEKHIDQFVRNDHHVVFSCKESPDLTLTLESIKNARSKDKQALRESLKRQH